MLKKQLLKDKKVRKAYDDLRPEFLLIRAIIKRRIQRKLTQLELAHKLGTKQSAIARLESGTGNPTIGFLDKVAKALEAKLSVTISSGTK